MLDAGLAAHTAARISTRPDDLAASTADLGGVCHARPVAVAHPVTPQDVAAAVRWAAERQLPYRARGTGHTMGGQSLADGGLHLNLRGLARIVAVTDDEIDVEAGVLLHDIVTTAAAHGRRLAGGTTSYTQLTIGGVASVGGVSTLPRAGAVIDHIRRLQVATPEGLVWCSPSEHAGLFHTVLGGLGRAGVITRVVLQLVELPTGVRTWTATYPRQALTEAMAAVTRLACSSEVDETMLLLSGAEPDTVSVQASSYRSRTQPNPTRPAALPDQDGQATLAAPVDGDYLDHVFRLDPLYDQPGWEASTKIWTDVWLPEHTLADYAVATLGQLTRRELSPTSYALLFPHDRDAFIQGNLRLPRATSRGELVALVDVLRDDYGRTGDEHWVADMRAAHHAALTRAHAAEGTVYPIGTPQPAA